MKIIAYLLEYPIDLPGGAQMSTESLCNALILDGEFKPVVVCPKLLKKDAKDYSFDIITYEMGDKRIKNLLIRILAFRKILKRLKPDIVHIQMPESLITYGFAFPLKNKKNVIFSDRGMYFGYRKHSMFVMKWILKKCGVMLTTTDLNKQLWTENTTIRPIKKISNTISERFLEFDESKRKHEGFVIGFAGRVCEEKNWPLVNVICEGCRKAGMNIKVDVVMSTFEDGDEKVVESVFEGLKSSLGSENVTLNLDYTQGQMADYYYGIDVFVMTSKFESFGKAAVEAMSRKCSVVSTDVGGLKEVIAREENLYSEDSINKCIGHIKELYEDRELLAKEQNYFYNRYLNTFSQKKCVEDHKMIYREII